MAVLQEWTRPTIDKTFGVAHIAQVNRRNIMAESLSYRLPRTVVPRRYQLEITPDLSAGFFQGTGSVEIEILADLNEIALNAVNLTIKEVVLASVDDTRFHGTASYQPEEEQAIVTFPSSIAPGKWMLSFQFDGVLASDLRGFYRTTVTGSDDTPVVIASTQCEATDARRVFPCWDEPEFKATFAITLVVDPSLTALSNAHEIDSHLDDAGKRRVTFAETIPMSTYLVALIVGPFEMTPPVMVDQVPVRIAARPGFSHLTGVAQTAAVQTLQFFQHYFEIPYPADKIDHVAIPDFAAGAMENLGCVTYREEALLIDPDRSSPVEKMQVVNTIAHETAHMWFGDLVTMRWWNGIWLNEAFATFMQLLATDALHPEWDIWTMFGRDRAYAFAVDGLAATRPIEYPVGPPIEAWAMFDVLTYQKGGSVLRMMEQYLGRDIFRLGVGTYLTQHRYGNTETGDLWDALEEVSGQPIREVMDSWVFQAGYPLVKAEWEHHSQKLKLSQKQFRYQGTGNGVWKVPVVLGINRTDGCHETIQVILGGEPVEISLPENTGWIRVNQGGWGFYRVAYDAPLWERLTAALGEMTALERLSLVDDVWAAVLADEVALPQAIQLWRTFVNERDPDVWGVVSSNLALLDVMADQEGRLALQKLVQSIARPVFDDLKWESSPQENVQRGRLRAAMVRLLSTIGADQSVRSQARERLMAHINGTGIVAPELLNAVVEVVADAGSEPEWDLMYHQFKRAATPQDELRYLYALANFPEPRLAQRTFDLYLSPEVRIQNGALAIGRALRNRHVHQMVWNLVEEHWDEILAKYPPFMIQPIVTPIAAFVEDDLAEQTVAWLSAHPVPEAARQIAQALEFQGIHRAMAQRVVGRLAQLLGS